MQTCSATSVTVDCKDRFHLIPVSDYRRHLHMCPLLFVGELWMWNETWTGDECGMDVMDHVRPHGVALLVTHSSENDVSI